MQGIRNLRKDRFGFDAPFWLCYTRRQKEGSTLETRPFGKTGESLPVLSFGAE
jgi:hypothetical protein